MGKIVLGLTERIRVQDKWIIAKIDTGAFYNSISKELAKELKLGPIKRMVSVKSANGIEERPIVDVNLEIKGKKIKTEFNIANRGHLKYPALIGLTILNKGWFIIDPKNETGSS